jgi:acyl dehydratase
MSRALVDPTMISVGDVVPALERTIELPDMVAYAGSTWDWHKLHYDPVYLAQKKVPAPVVDGQVFGAYLVEQLQDWLGPKVWVKSLEFRFKNLVFAGDTIRCTATVTSVESTDDGVVIGVESQVEVVGDKPRVAAAPCAATVIISP